MKIRKTIVLSFILVLCFSVVMVIIVLISPKASGVKYISPKCGSEISLKRGESAVFKWTNANPLAQNKNDKVIVFSIKDMKGQDIYRQSIQEKNGDSSVIVPAAIFADGGTYNWQIEEPETDNRSVSSYLSWQFKVKK